MTTKIKDIVNEIANLSLLESLDLVKLLEKTFDIEPLNLTQALSSTTNTSEVEVAKEVKTEEKTAFDLILTEVSAEKKIAVLKLVRQITGLGLREAKEIVDNISKAPKTIKEGLSKEECEKLAKELELAGAKVNIK